MSLTHIYRRGHVFSWRRVHRISDGERLDIRISLKTFDRLEARNRGAALSAATGGVVAMLNDRIGETGQRPTEDQLQAVAKAIYGEILGDLCADQRATPYLADEHSAANRAFADYFQRLTRNGGHASLLPAEVARLEADGWDSQRIDDLRAVIALREEKGFNPVRPELIDRHLRDAGLAPHPFARWMVEVAAYPAFRDAYLEADRRLSAALAPAGPAVTEDRVEQVATPPVVDAQTDGGPADWQHCTPREAAERLIASTPKMFEHRQGGKRAKEQVGEQTLRQIRWASTLLEKSLPAGTPLWKVTETDIKRLDAYFDQLPVTFGKSVKDHDPAVTLPQAAAEAAERVDAGDLDPEAIGLKTGTTNKHYNKLAQVHGFMCDNVPAARRIKFSAFTAPIDEDEMAARLRYTVEQGRAIFLQPPWTGCSSPSDRLSPGSTIIHDGLFFILLLVWYTGARREELCKLLAEDVEQRHGQHYLVIRTTITGRVKNRSASRVVVIADELIRLGFIRYVETMRVAGEKLLFPELLPAEGTKRKLGDVFYKQWWIYLKPMIPGLQRGQAMHSARHMVADELKDQEVFIEFRNDHLGHKGKGGEGETRYPSRASLERLKSVVERIPVVTDL